MSSSLRLQPGSTILFEGDSLTGLKARQIEGRLNWNLQPIYTLHFVTAAKPEVELKSVARFRAAGEVNK